MKAKWFVLAFHTLFFCQAVSAYRILTVFPHPGSSHFAVFKPLLINLAKKGHEMTIVSHFPLETPLKNYEDISLRGTLPIWKSIFKFEFFVYFTPTEKIVKHWKTAEILTKMGYQACEAMMEDKSVQELKRGQFDLVLVEDFNSDCAMGLVHKLKAPFVGFTSNGLMPWTSGDLDLMDNPTSVPLHFLGYGTRPTLIQSIDTLILSTFYKWYFYIFSQIPEREMLKKYVGDDLPPLGHVKRNMSLLLTNTYFPMSGARSYPPNVIEVGGIYHGEVKELPKDIKTFLDNAKEGVILFSMGSMLNATSLDGDKLNAFQMAFSELKQKVLMKWEDDLMPEKPDNVKITKWLPQYDALHHENVVGFVTHAGMLGLSEAVRAGVPVLCIPMYGDQFLNAVSASENGMGVTIQYKNITKESISWALGEILSSRMQNNADRLSMLWKDRPQSAMETGIYWIEHVAKYGGKHLLPSSLELPWYRKMMLDLYATLIFTISLFLFVVFKSLKCMLRLCRKKSKED